MNPGKTEVGEPPLPRCEFRECTEYPRQPAGMREPRPKLVYLIGEPGIGKSTTMAALTAHLTPSLIVGDPITRTMLLDRVGNVVAVELGRRRDGFPGTDTLSMDAVVPAERYLRGGGAAAETGLLLGEGARLANARFLTAAIDSGWDVYLIHLTGRTDLAARRRDARGSEQNESWIRGRATAAQRLAENPPAGIRRVMRLDAGQSPPQVARLIVGCCAPELAAPWHAGIPT